MSKSEENKISRRRYLELAGGAVAGLVVGGALGYVAKPEVTVPPTTVTVTETGTVTGIVTATVAPAKLPYEGVKIRLVGPPPSGPPDSALAELKQQTGMEVELDLSDWEDVNNKITTAGAAGSNVGDVVEIDLPYPAQYAGAGWLEPLDDLIPSEMRNDIPLFPVFMWEGKTWGIPYNADFRMFGYNYKHVVDAGYDDPIKACDTWDGFIEVCNTIKSKGITEFPWDLAVGPTVHSAVNFQWLVYSKGGRVFDDNMDFVFNTTYKTETTEAMQLFVDGLYKYKIIDPVMTTMGTPDANTTMTTGKGSFTELNPGRIVSQFNNPDKSKIAGDARLMMLPGTHDTCQAAEAVGIWSKSTQKEAAWEFLKWYASPENEVTMFVERGRPPPRLSALQMVLDRKLVADWDIAQWMKAAPRIVAHSQPPWTAVFWDLMSDAVNKMAKREKSIQQALDDLESKAKTLKAQYA